MNFEECSEEKNNPKLVVEQTGRKFVILNPKRLSITKVVVDGCLIEDTRPRCDYLFEIGRQCNCAVYLELKGHDLQRAFNQLVATMGYLEARHTGIDRICHIVASRVPRAGPKVQEMKVRMLKRQRALLLVGTHTVSIDVDKSPYRVTQ